MIEELKRYIVLNKKCTLKDLERLIKPASSKAFTELVRSINILEEERFIYNDHNMIYHIDHVNFDVGTCKDVSRDEIAIFTSDDKYYVRKKKNMKIFDKDEVLIKIDRHDVLIIKVLNHGMHKITGDFIVNKKGIFFYSDLDLHCKIIIDNLRNYTFKRNTKVVCDIVKYSDPLHVKITNVIGDPKQAGNDITSLLIAHNVRMDFNQKIDKELKKIPDHVDSIKGRNDLRSLLTITIDGDDAKDFDDAISIEKNDNGYTLYVHIADVSHYVKEHSSIDQEAYLRSTSIYVCDRVVPMLPFQLSNGICSLNPNVDRLTITCQMQINVEGYLDSYSIYPSIIHSNKRCTYNKVNACLENGLDEYDDIYDMLKDLETCCRKLNERSHDRGCINFDTTESKIELNKKGIPVSISAKTRGFAEQMIEECMIMANICVAHHLHVNNIPCAYRVHEIPDPEKVEKLCKVAQYMHIPFDFYPDEVSAIQIQQFLESISDPDQFTVLSMISLRTMQKARYDKECLGHFGLALDEYCHFTSPIRRYSDLIVHRMLHAYCFNEQKRDIEHDDKLLEKQCFYISSKERDAIMIERLVDDHKKAEFMKNKIGCTFDGIIVGVQNFGFFVELENTIEGLVPVHTLSGFYEYDEDFMELKDQFKNESFHLGKKVKVICTDVSIEKGQVTFGLVK